MQAGTYYSTRSEDALNRTNTFEATGDPEIYQNASLEALRMLIGEAETRRLAWGRLFLVCGPGAQPFGRIPGRPQMGSRSIRGVEEGLWVAIRTRT